MQDKQYEKLLGKAFFFLKSRQRSEFEMRQYLEKKAQALHVQKSVIDQVIARLCELKYLDDKAYAESHVRSRIRGKPKGEYALRQELSAKGIQNTIIDQYFENHPLDEGALSYKALQAKWPLYRNLEYATKKRRATDFLLRRGFSYDSIREALERAEASDDIET